jgi:chromosome partitioning protein
MPATASVVPFESPRHARVVVLVTAPKGGVGKTTISRALLVSGAMAGLRVVGIDLDKQSLARWGERRAKTRAAAPLLPEVEVRMGNLGDWRNIIKSVAEYDLVILDTPPGVKGAIPPLQAIASEVADYVIVPSGVTDDDLSETLEWGRALRGMAKRVSFCASAVDDKTDAYKGAVTKMNRACNVLPVPIPRLGIIPKDADIGLTVLDCDPATVRAKDRKAHEKALGAFVAVWDTIRRETGL